MHLVSFVHEKHSAGVPWAHIANMAGRAIEDVKRCLDLPTLRAAPAEPVIVVAPPPEPPPPSTASRMELTARLVASEYGFSVRDLRKHGGAGGISAARQHLMWLLSNELGLSLQQIGDFMGGRDSTTVGHGIRRHAQRIAQ